MIRKHFHLPDEQVRYLYEASKSTGLKESEIVRRIIDKHIVENSPNKTSASQSQRKEANG
jgi:predicted DNA-binding protein